MAPRRRASLGVDWYLPGSKPNSRPIGETTQASSDLAGLLAEDGHTVRSAIAAIRWDDELKAVLTVLAEHGYADRPLADLVRAR